MAVCAHLVNRPSRRRTVQAFVGIVWFAKESKNEAPKGKITKLIKAKSEIRLGHKTTKIIPILKQVASTPQDLNRGIKFLHSLMAPKKRFHLFILYSPISRLLCTMQVLQILHISGCTQPTFAQYTDAIHEIYIVNIFHTHTVKNNNLNSCHRDLSPPQESRALITYTRIPLLQIFALFQKVMVPAPGINGHIRRSCTQSATLANRVKCSLEL